MVVVLVVGILLILAGHGTRRSRPLTDAPTLSLDNRKLDSARLASPGDLTSSSRLAFRRVEIGVGSTSVGREYVRFLGGVLRLLNGIILWYV